MSSKFLTNFREGSLILPALLVSLSSTNRSFILLNNKALPLNELTRSQNLVNHPL